MNERRNAPGLRLALDYGPLLVFLLINFLAPGEPMRRMVAATPMPLSDLNRLEALLIARVIVATVAFMLATVVALIVSRVRLGNISPMLLISSAMVIVFGGLTIYFRDPHFIKMKPTFVYAILAALLFFGLWSGRPLLQGLLGSTYPGLDAAGWRKLTRNWAAFFVVMAVLNELVWRRTEATMGAEAALRAWSLYKMPGCVILTVVFAAANIPMLTRHGLLLDEGRATAGQLPPE